MSILPISCSLYFIFPSRYFRTLFAFSLFATIVVSSSFSIHDVIRELKCHCIHVLRFCKQHNSSLFTAHDPTFLYVCSFLFSPLSPPSIFPHVSLISSTTSFARFLCLQIRRDNKHHQVLFFPYTIVSPSTMSLMLCLFQFVRVAFAFNCRFPTLVCLLNSLHYCLFVIIVLFYLFAGRPVPFLLSGCHHFHMLFILYCSLFPPASFQVRTS